MGLDGSASGFALDLPEPTTSAVLVQGTAEQSWPGRDSISLLRLPPGFNPTATVALRLGAGLIAHLETSDVKELERSTSDFPSDEALSTDFGSPTRLDQLLRYASPDARISVETKPSLVPQDVTLAAASLVSSIEADGSRSHEFALRLLAGRPHEVEFSLPSGAELRSVRQGRRLVHVLGKGPTLVAPIAWDVGEDRPEVHFSYIERGKAVSRGAVRYRPVLPELKIHCVSFQWTVLPPDGVVLDRTGGGLTRIDPLAWGSRRRPFGVEMSGLLLVSRRSKNVAVDGPDIAELDRRVAGLRASKPPDLGTALSTLATTDLAVVVDRLAFRDEGLSPSSSWNTTAQAPRGVSIDGTRLSQGNLCFFLRRGAVAITVRSSPLVAQMEEASPRSEVERSIEEAARRGVSADGRWAAVEEWTGTQYSVDVSADGATRIAARRWDFACAGWPGDEAWIEVTSGSSSILAFAIGWIIPLLIGLVARPMSRIRRCILLLLLTWAGAFVVFPATGLIQEEMRWGALLGLVSAWLVQAPARRRGDEARSPETGESRPRPLPMVTASLVVFVIGSLCTERSTSFGFQAPNRDAEQILAILPFDGSNPQAAATRVVLRLQDYVKLKAAEPKSPVRSELFAIDAMHRLRILDSRFASLVSALTLRLDADLPVEWRFPTENASQILAFLDDKPHPVRIEDEGRVGVVALVGRGQHRLRIERTIPVMSPGGLFSIDAAVNPIARARLEAAAPPPWKLLAEGASAGGVAVSMSANGPVGCSDSIRMTWAGDGKTLATTNKQVQGLILWDALPTGDLLHVRLAPAGPGELWEVRLRLDAGVGLRVLEPRRHLRSGYSKGAGVEDWPLTFDRPGREGDPIELEIWRPRSDGAAPTISPRRRCPRAEMVGADFQGTIALRRPSDWSGRLDGASGLVPRDDETFVKAWGSLPADPLTLAGTAGFRGVAAPEVDLSPVPLQRTVRMATSLDLGDGRADMQIEATLQDQSGRSNDVDIELPADFVFEGVDADGLLGASSPRKGSVHLEFFRLPTPTRKLTIRGSMVCAIKNPGAGSGQYEVARVWPRWMDSIDEGGSLTLTASTRPSLDAGPLVKEVPVSGPGPGANPETRFRRLYRVERGDDVGAARWLASPPRVAVTIQSRLAIEGHETGLDASIQYDVSGGPLGAIHFRLPTLWADKAKVQLIGETFQTSIEVRGDWTFWTIRPDRPLWGGARLHVTSSRPNEEGRAFAFPDVVPLGQGQVEKLITVVRRTGRPIEVEGSAGVLAVDPDRVSDGSRVAARAETVGAYRVTAEKWFLSIRIGGDPRLDPGDGLGRIIDSQTSCSLRDDGKLIGTTTWLVDANVGRSLRFELGRRAKVLHAQAGHRSLPVLSGSPGAWTIPFDSAGILEVDVLWSDETSGDDPAAGELNLPRPLGFTAPTLVRLAASPAIEILTGTSAYESIGVHSWRIERTERLASRIRQFLEDFDRSSAQQAAALSVLLTRFALEARLAERAIRSIGPPAAAGPEPVDGDALDRLTLCRTAVSERLELYGLDEFQSYLGSEGPPQISAAGDDRIMLAPQAPQPTLLGDATYYRTKSNGPENTPAFRWRFREPGRSEDLRIASAVALVFILGILMPRSLGVRIFLTRTVGIALAILLLIVAAVAPLPGMVLLLAAWAGRH